MAIKTAVRITSKLKKNQRKVLLLENIHQGAVDEFIEKGYDVEVIPRALNEEELKKKIKSISILGIRSKTNITPAVLEVADALEVIGCFCIGTNQVDLLSATQHGVAVFNAPYSNTRSVVEFTIAEIIALRRHLVDKNNAAHQGLWDKSANGCNEIRNQTLGIVGYGNIGSQLSVVAENLGMKVRYFDLYDKLSLGTTRRCESLEELLSVSDIVSVHVDGRSQNKNLIGDAELKAMKTGAIFINSSRGKVVDIKALKKYLVSGHLSGAAVDVYPVEPKERGAVLVTELRGLPNVILTPHIAGVTEESQADAGHFVATKLMKYIDQGSTSMSVNMPHQTLPLNSDVSRLLFIHRNVPGVMARVNGLAAEHEVNIVGQYLATNGETGCVITDMAEKDISIIVDQLKKLPETIHLRVVN